MLKYKYIIVKRDFPDLKAFQEYLNRLGQRGYELVQWLLDFSYDDASTLSILTTWKIEDHDS